ncbi:hypothetical protein DL98DRAFT_238812 [Cadophora sp. DSE1049]|nr:hypothetical protein DL98DRAFT_238812 [Cadophora sp. DSE1049]
MAVRGVITGRCPGSLLDVFPATPRCSLTSKYHFVWSEPRFISSRSTLLCMSSISLSTKVPKSTISISLIAIAGERYVVQIETDDLPRYDTKDGDTFDIPADWLKTMLWSRWQTGWGFQPPDPSRIRLVHFGQTISDFMSLRCNVHGFDS